jgi:hypothetical protein
MKNLLIILVAILTVSCSKNSYKLSYYEKNSNNYLAEQSQETVKKNEHKKEVRSSVAHRKQMKLEKYLHEVNDVSINRINAHQKRVKKPGVFY